MTNLLFLVTGSRGAGKTTFCDTIARAARDAGWQAAGILSRAVFEGSQRIAIDAEDLTSGQVKRLAARSDQPTPGSRVWKFDDAAIDWGNRIFAGCLPCDLLVVDEVGPLELERGAGWQKGLDALDSGQYAIAFVVVRAELLGDALLRWPDAEVIEIDTPDDSARKAEALAAELF